MNTTMFFPLTIKLAQVATKVHMTVVAHIQLLTTIAMWATLPMTCYTQAHASQTTNYLITYIVQVWFLQLPFKMGAGCRGGGLLCRRIIQICLQYAKWQQFHHKLYNVKKAVKITLLQFTCAACNDRGLYYIKHLSFMGQY